MSYFWMMINRLDKFMIRPVKLLLCLLLFHQGFGQSKVLKRIIKDAHSDERIPFASLQLQSARTGRLSDSAGTFLFRFDEWPQDTLIITYVGYQEFHLAIDSALISKASKNVIDITIQLERAKYEAVIVRQKIDRGYL